MPKSLKEFLNEKARPNSPPTLMLRMKARLGLMEERKNSPLKEIYGK